MMSRRGNCRSVKIKTGPKRVRAERVAAVQRGSRHRRTYSSVFLQLALWLPIFGRAALRTLEDDSIILWYKRDWFREMIAPNDIFKQTGSEKPAVSASRVARFVLLCAIIIPSSIADSQRATCGFGSRRPCVLSQQNRFVSVAAGYAAVCSLDHQNIPFCWGVVQAVGSLNSVAVFL